ncbi:MAG TPA: CapA family protein [Methanothermobacter sp.]|nr:CapA family protein [Methanothermobacter sp.]HPQ05357.1 CapA family protein [Methanothermobacter sp.]HPU36935.1 CapA family protein [Methanothermobacter sp.]
MKIILIGAVTILILGLVVSNLTNPKDKESEESINITFTGDVMLGRNVDPILHEDPQPFRNVINLTNGTDLTIINLESPITNSTDPRDKIITFKADPQFTKSLKDAGVDVACLANNHIMDFKETGLNDTIKNLKANNIKYVGAGPNITEAYKPLIIEVKGKKIAIIQASEFADEYYMPPATQNRPGFAPISWEHIKAAIDDAKNAGADYIICEFHYGNEYRYTPNEVQKDIYKCIDEGAFIVVGHHPHVPGGIEKYKGHFIFYSLGNCVFDMQNPETKRSMIIVVTIKGNSSIIHIYPINIIGCYPQLMDVDDANAFLEELESYSNVEIQTKNGIGIIT